jgi:hypothetical protein
MVQHKVHQLQPNQIIVASPKPGRLNQTTKLGCQSIAPAHKIREPAPGCRSPDKKI